jgi:hypothetical protein
MSIYKAATDHREHLKGIAIDTQIWRATIKERTEFIFWLSIAGHPFRVIPDRYRIMVHALEFGCEPCRRIPRTEEEYEAVAELIAAHEKGSLSVS